MIGLFKQLEVINSVGPVLETEAAPSDNHENASGPSTPSRKDLYWQVSHRGCKRKAEFGSCYTIIAFLCFISILRFKKRKSCFVSSLKTHEFNVRIFTFYAWPT